MEQYSLQCFPDYGFNHYYGEANFTSMPSNVYCCYLKDAVTYRIVTVYENAANWRARLPIARGDAGGILTLSIATQDLLDVAVLVRRGSWDRSLDAVI